MSDLINEVAVEEEVATEERTENTDERSAAEKILDVVKDNLFQLKPLEAENSKTFGIILAVPIANDGFETVEHAQFVSDAIARRLAFEEQEKAANAAYLEKVGAESPDAIAKAALLNTLARHVGKALSSILSDDDNDSDDED